MGGGGRQRGGGGGGVVGCGWVRELGRGGGVG